MAYMVHDCMEYTERAETTTVSCGTSHVTIKQRCKYSTLKKTIFKTRFNCCCFVGGGGGGRRRRRLVVLIHLESHVSRAP